MSIELKVYLGDGVYAEFDGYSITLTTEYGNGPTNTIDIEPGVIAALEAYVKRLEAATAEIKRNNEAK